MEGKVFITSTNGNCDLVVWTALGKVIRFNNTDVRVRATNKNSKGVKAIRLEEGDKVTGITTITKHPETSDYYFAIVDEQGNIKILLEKDIPITCRAGKGIKI